MEMRCAIGVAPHHEDLECKISTARGLTFKSLSLYKICAFYKYTFSIPKAILNVS